jgi:hypothetical protein
MLTTRSRQATGHLHQTGNGAGQTSAEAVTSRQENKNIVLNQIFII